MTNTAVLGEPVRSRLFVCLKWLGSTTFYITIKAGNISKKRRVMNFEVQIPKLGILFEVGTYLNGLHVISIDIVKGRLM